MKSSPGYSIVTQQLMPDPGIIEIQKIRNGGTADRNLGVSKGGPFNDGVGMAGARAEFDSFGGRLPCVSPMGGCQGPVPAGMNVPQYSFAGFSYNPDTPVGSMFNYVNEAFGGPHDFLRDMTGSYLSNGDAIHFTGASAVVDSIRNYGLVVPAAPFAAASMIPASTYGVLSDY